VEQTFPLGFTLSYCAGSDRSFVVVELRFGGRCGTDAAALQELNQLWQPPLPVLRLDIPEVGKKQQQSRPPCWPLTARPETAGLPTDGGKIFTPGSGKSLPQCASVVLVTGGEHWIIRRSTSSDRMHWVFLAVVLGKGLNIDTLPQEAALLQCAYCLTAAEAVGRTN